MAAEDLAQALSYGPLILIGLVLLWFLIASITAFRVVEKGTAVVVERWGKFNRLLRPGLHYIIPVMEKARVVTWRDTEANRDAAGYQSINLIERKTTRIDLRDDVLDMKPQSVITRDNVEVVLHPLVVYRVHDAIRLCYETVDPVHALTKIVQTTLRAIVGGLGLDDTLASREEINRLLSSKIKRTCWDWGMEVIKVELLELMVSLSITAAMVKQLSAERVRRAAIITADGHRESTKTSAEGNAAALIATSKGEEMKSILNAQADYEAKVLLAEAEATAINTVADAVKDLGGDPTRYLIAIKYIDTLKSIALGAKNRLIYFPYETDVFGSLAKVR